MSVKKAEARLHATERICVAAQAPSQVRIDMWNVAPAEFFREAILHCEARRTPFFAAEFRSDCACWTANSQPNPAQCEALCWCDLHEILYEQGKWPDRAFAFMNSSSQGTHLCY